MLSDKERDIELCKDGWRRINAGHTEAIDYNARFDLYKRQRKLTNVIKKTGNGDI